MSNEKKKKQVEYKEYCKRWIIIQSVIIAILTLIAVLSTVIYCRNNETNYINYTESSDIDYRVYLKENDYYKEEYLGKDQIYVSSLIDKVVADFKYEFAVSEENANIQYSYRMDTQVKVIDKDTKVEIFNQTKEIKSDLILCKEKTNKINISQQINIDYDQPNQVVQSFSGTYDLKNTMSTLDVNMYVKIHFVNGEVLKDTKSEYVITLNIPLVEQKVNIQMTSSIPEVEGKIAYENTKKVGIYIIIAIISSILDILAIIAMIMFIYLTRKLDANYAVKVKKIVNKYKSHIQKINNKFVYNGYQVLMVDTFKEMLKIGKISNAPILMNENDDQTCTRFIIPTNTKLLYMFEIKVEGSCYDPDEELLGFVEELNADVQAENETIVGQEENLRDGKKVEGIVQVKQVKEPKPKKVINPSIEVLAEYIKSNFEDAMIVYGKENKSYRVYRKKKLFLVVQSTNNDYRMIFQRKPISMAKLLIKYSKFISKANSPQGEQWFKVVNKGDIYEEDLKAMIKFSHKYLVDEENKFIAKKEKEKEKALAKKAAIKAKEKAKKDALKEKEKAAVLKEKSKQAISDKSKEKEDNKVEGNNDIA